MTTSENDQYLKKLLARRYALEKELIYDKAKRDMLTFLKATMPDPGDDDNPHATLYEVTPLSQLLCDIVERADKGTEKRICVSVGPQFGKSQILSRAAPAWLSGRNPSRHMILGSYNDTFASEFGSDVRDIMQSAEFGVIFPDHQLKRGSESKSLLQTTRGGKLAFVGTGGSGTGKRADYFFIDDPYKNDEEAQSETYREKVWKWLTSVAYTRCHKDSVIIIVHTRWHEDDLIGRLVDPDHPERNGKYAGHEKLWKHYNYPAVIKDPDTAAMMGLMLKTPTDERVIQQFGPEPIISLWENRKSTEFLAEAKQMDPRVFGALYMGEPSPDEGTYFTMDMIDEYDPVELPENLEIYGASDHAVSEKQKADYSVLGCVGVDCDDTVWILPDLTWDRMETDVTVEELILKMQHHKPNGWWLEDELISKSFGPFLKKRMQEERVYTTLLRRRPAKDKRTRARAIQGLMSHGKVKFPRRAPWWAKAKQQLLKFPYGSHDDFVDWLSWIGLGLQEEYGASKPKQDKVIEVGSFAWIKNRSNLENKLRQRETARKGW